MTFSETMLPYRPFVWRTLAMLVLVALCGFLLQHRIAEIEGAALAAAIAATPLVAILGALALGALSHVALAGYDLLAFRRIGRRVPTGRCLTGGFAGTVLSQVVGLGLITGSFARARIYRANGIIPAEALALSGFVAAGFFAGLSLLLCILTVADPSLVDESSGVEAGLVRAIALVTLAGVVLLCIALRGRQGEARIAGVRLRMPTGRWLLGATTLAAADLIPAALCLAVLLPSEALPGFSSFVAIYITAVALGHMIGSPGAVGPFEGVLFLALPTIPAAELAAGILVYRLVYYAPPFLLALGLIGAARRKADTVLTRPEALPDRVAWALDDADNAEAELACLGDKQIFFPADSAAFAMYASVGRVWLMMGDPVGPRRDWAVLMDAFDAAAGAAGARIAVYKASDAAFWQSRSLSVQPLGEDGVLDLRGFTLAGRDRRELRRKLSQAGKAGISFEHFMPATAPMDALADIAADWRAAKGGREQTFSMGHWDRDFVMRHPVFVAMLGKRPVAFVSVWVSGDGATWMLDLMRQRRDVPNGTMHALIIEAVQAAANAGAVRFNLCMAPLTGLERIEPVTGLSRAAHGLVERFARRHGLHGLRRFKEIFRPGWAPRYLVSRGGVHTAEALMAAMRLVHGKAGQGQSGAFSIHRAPFRAETDDPRAAGFVSDRDAA